MNSNRGTTKRFKRMPVTHYPAIMLSLRQDIPREVDPKFSNLNVESNGLFCKSDHSQWMASIQGRCSCSSWNCEPSLKDAVYPTIRADGCAEDAEFELSLTDLVEFPARSMQEKKSKGDAYPAQVAQSWEQRKKTKRSWRSQSMDNGVGLLKWLFPVSLTLGEKKKRLGMISGSPPAIGAKGEMVKSTDGERFKKKPTLRGASSRNCSVKDSNGNIISR